MDATQANLLTFESPRHGYGISKYEANTTLIFFFHKDFPFAPLTID